MSEQSSEPRRKSSSSTALEKLLKKCPTCHNQSVIAGWCKICAGDVLKVLQESHAAKLKEGWLLTRDANGKWNRIFMVILETVELAAYTDESKSRLLNKVSLEGSQVVASLTTGNVQNDSVFCVKLPSANKIIFQAIDSIERVNWVRALVTAGALPASSSGKLLRTGNKSKKMKADSIMEGTLEVKTATMNYSPRYLVLMHDRLLLFMSRRGRSNPAVLELNNMKVEPHGHHEFTISSNQTQASVRAKNSFTAEEWQTALKANIAKMNLVMKLRDEDGLRRASSERNKKFPEDKERPLLDRASSFPTLDRPSSISPSSAKPSKRASSPHQLYPSSSSDQTSLSSSPPSSAAAAALPPPKSDTAAATAARPPAPAKKLDKAPPSRKSSARNSAEIFPTVLEGEEAESAKEKAAGWPEATKQTVSSTAAAVKEKENENEKETVKEKEKDKSTEKGQATETEKENVSAVGKPGQCAEAAAAAAALAAQQEQDEEASELAARKAREEAKKLEEEAARAAAEELEIERLQKSIETGLSAFLEKSTAMYSGSTAKEEEKLDRTAGPKDSSLSKDGEDETREESENEREEGETQTEPVMQDGYDSSDDEMTQALVRATRGYTSEDEENWESYQLGGDIEPLEGDDMTVELGDGQEEEFHRRSLSAKPGALLNALERPVSLDWLVAAAGGSEDEEDTVDPESKIEKEDPVPAMESWTAYDATKNWTCPICFVDVQASNSHCKFCGGGRPNERTSMSATRGVSLSTSGVNLGRPGSPSSVTRPTSKTAVTRPSSKTMPAQEAQAPAPEPEPPAQAWMCPICFVEIEAGLEHCKLCGGGRPGPSPNRQASRTTVQFNEDIDHGLHLPPGTRPTSRSVVHRPNEEQVEVAAHVEGRWVCQTCNVEMTAKEDECRICGTGRPYVQEARGFPYQLKHKRSVYEGWLLKKTKRKGNEWQPRYFVCLDNAIMYFKNYEDKRPVGVIVLTAQAIVRIENLEGCNFSIIPDLGARKFVLTAKDTSDMEVWSGIITSRIDEKKKIFDEPRSKRQYQSIKEGWLMKTVSSRIKWKKRFFVLCGKDLMYYKSRDKGDPTGVIPLSELSKVARVPPNELRKLNLEFAFKVQPEALGRIYICATGSEADLEAWLKCFYDLLAELQEKAKQKQQEKGKKETALAKADAPSKDSHIDGSLLQPQNLIPRGKKNWKHSLRFFSPAKGRDTVTEPES